jgi:hypothetical protein
LKAGQYPYMVDRKTGKYVDWQKNDRAFIRELNGE